MAYVPTHEQLTAPLPRGPGYAPPDLDPTRPMSDGDGGSPRPAKRRREDEGASSTRAGSSSGAPNGARPAGGRRKYTAAPPPERITMDTPIAPSLFGVTARNEFTETVGNFIMKCCSGRRDVEIEIKLGTLHVDGQPRRIHLPTMTELILPPDFPKGPFSSTMTLEHHKRLNNLLNQQVAGTANTEYPLYYRRVQQVDSFYKTRGGKVRVSREMDPQGGESRVVAVVRKDRLGDLNVVSPNQKFDWRVSCNVEAPVEIDVDALGEPESTRKKDRLCYEHQLCQVDLTAVTTSTGRNSPSGNRPVASMTYELEIEVRDAPALIAEGEKDAAGLPNRFEDMLQSILDTVRILVKNADP